VALDGLSKLFDAHREAILALVEVANRDVAAAEARAVAREARIETLITVLTGLIGLVSLGAILVARYRIARPLRAMTGCMTQLARGDTAIVVPGVSRGDELGDAARAIRN
jgi:methyl-accepting chemotaxis protein